MTNYPYDPAWNGGFMRRLDDLYGRRLGMNEYGHVGERLAGHAPAALLDRVFRTDDYHRTEILDPADGSVLMTARPYLGDPPDTTMGDWYAAQPNLEVPSLGLRVRWYKSAFRETKTNLNPTARLMDALERVMEPAVAVLEPYVERPGKPRAVEWTRVDHDEWTFAITGRRGAMYSGGGATRLRAGAHARTWGMEWEVRLRYSSYPNISDSMHVATLEEARELVRTRSGWDNGGPYVLRG